MKYKVNLNITYKVRDMDGNHKKERKPIVVVADGGDDAAKKAVEAFYDSDEYKTDKASVGRIVVNEIEPYVEDVTEQAEKLAALMESKPVEEPKAEEPKKGSKKATPKKSAKKKDAE